MTSATVERIGREGEKAVTPDHPVLRVHNEAYEAVVGVVQERAKGTDAEGVLRLVDVAAKVASEFHGGRFADGAVENVALEIGRRLERVAAGARLPMEIGAVGRGDGRRRVLHVASQVQGIGGHTRVIWNWAKEDRGSRHSLVLTEQGTVPVPGWLVEEIRGGGGRVHVLPWRSPIRYRAWWLREIAVRGADLVVLHHHPSDVVPTVGLATEECPPAGVLNHADHVFWMGGGVTDFMINLRGVSELLNGPRRFVERNALLPVPLPGGKQRMGRGAARANLGIPAGQVVLLSVGRAEKYQPCGRYNFFGTAAKVLKRNHGVHLYVVGVGPGDATARECEGVREQLHLVGSIEDPSAYWAAADVYVESFPFGSQTALLEAGAAGLPVVPAYDPMFPLLVANDDAVSEVLPNPGSEDEYIAAIEELVGSEGKRKELGEELRRRLVAEHTGEGWKERLAGVYREAERVRRHRPREIPVTRCEGAGYDVGLGEWQAMRGRVAGAGSSDAWGAVRGWLWGHACAAKDCGDFRSAWGMHLTSGRVCGWSGKTVGAMGKLVPQWVLKTNL